MKPFDIAVVGCGNVSNMHFGAYSAHPERIRLVAAFDPVKERTEQAQKKYGVEKIFGSLEEMIEQASWDVAVICTPTSVRRETIEALARAGKHVFTEKPLADTFGEASAIVNLCERSGVKLAVNQNFRYHYPFATAREVVASGSIGTPLTVLQEIL